MLVYSLLLPQQSLFNNTNTAKKKKKKSFLCVGTTKSKTKNRFFFFCGETSGKESQCVRTGASIRGDGDVGGGLLRGLDCFCCVSLSVWQLSQIGRAKRSRSGWGGRKREKKNTLIVDRLKKMPHPAPNSLIKAFWDFIHTFCPAVYNKSAAAVLFRVLVPCVFEFSNRWNLL